MNIFGPAIPPKARNECIDSGWIARGKNPIRDDLVRPTAPRGGRNGGKKYVLPEVAFRFTICTVWRDAGVVLLGFASSNGV